MKVRLIPLISVAGEMHSFISLRRRAKPHCDSKPKITIPVFMSISWSTWAGCFLLLLNSWWCLHLELVQQWSSSEDTRVAKYQSIKSLHLFDFSTACHPWFFQRNANISSSFTECKCSWIMTLALEMIGDLGEFREISYFWDVLQKFAFDEMGLEISRLKGCKFC